jgi:mxaJ protein
VRNTVGSGRCDVLMGVPSRFERTLVTRPYYQSSYVFVTRQHDGPRVRSLDDDVLRHVRVGVQLIGDDGENSPPAHALAARQIVENVVGYTVYGDYLEPNPPAKIVDAVARGEIDVAIVWGPLAGYFAPLQSTPLELTPVTPQVDRILPFTFDISVGVARRARALRDEIDKVLDRRRADIDRLLAEYRVPRVDHAN